MEAGLGNTLRFQLIIFCLLLGKKLRLPRQQPKLAQFWVTDRNKKFLA